MSQEIVCVCVCVCVCGFASGIPFVDGVWKAAFSVDCTLPPSAATQVWRTRGLEELRMLRRNAVEAFRAPVLWRRMLSSEGAGNVIKDVRSLRSGLTARDLDQVWEAWTSLRAQQALDQLRRHDYADLLALVRANLSTFSHESCRQEAWKNRCLAWGMNAAAVSYTHLRAHET